MVEARQEIPMDPFSSKDIFQLKYLAIHDEEPWHGFSVNTNSSGDHLHLADIEGVDVPDLDPKILKLSLDDVSLDVLDISETTPSDSQTAGSMISQERLDENREGDIWNAKYLSDKCPKNKLLRWDHFNKSSEDSTAPNYLSEAEPSLYDAVRSHSWRVINQLDCKYVRLEHFLPAALNVLVGRSSSVFEWNEKNSVFETALDRFALPGHSDIQTTVLCEALSSCGSSFRHIQTFCKASATMDATTFAIRSCLLHVLNGIEHDWQHKAVAQLSLVRLQRICIKHAEMYEILHPIIAFVRSAKDESHTIAKVIQYIDQTWLSNDSLRALLTDMAVRILQPGIDETCKQIGLDTPRLNAAADTVWIFARLLPHCYSTFQEVVKCLTVGNEHGARMKLRQHNTTTLELVHQWSDLPDIQRKSDGLEAESRKAHESQEFVEVAREEASSDMEAVNPFRLDFQFNPDAFDAIHEQSTSDAHLSNLLSNALGDKTQTNVPDISPMQMLELSLRPFLEAQRRVCSYTLLRSVFLEHDLVAHLNLLREFSLLGNGHFAARLSKALFDANENSAEGRRKTGLTAGLRLENRDVWPPASSELRLVLMDLLSEGLGTGKTAILIDSISFAIRDLPEEDIELCRDVHSIHALDFLRLAYAAPNPILELIITSPIVEKYDRIFKFLLILLRMHALAKSLVRTNVGRREGGFAENPNRRFCLDLYYFVSGFLDYALNVAIDGPWRTVFHYFRTVHESLVDDDYNRCMSLVGSLEQLRTAHEDALDSILTALLLKGKQSKLFATTCEVFTVGLRFAKDHSGRSGQDCTKQYKALQWALDNWFLQTNRSMQECDSTSLQLLNHLLIKVDFSGYYQRKMKVRSGLKS